MSQDPREEVVLAVGEAAANSVEHAYDPGEASIVELTFWTESDALCVEVADRGRWRERRRPLGLSGRETGVWNVPDFIDTGLGCQVGEFSES
jgi:anti-sigma regulatory factor (Ser/Thr protein kinase)